MSLVHVCLHVVSLVWWLFLLGSRKGCQDIRWCSGVCQCTSMVVLPTKMSAGGQCRVQKSTWRGHGDGCQCIH